MLIRNLLTTIVAIVLLAAASPAAQNGRQVSGSGEFEVITGTDPAAGIEISQTVPTGFNWRISSLTATLVTSATVANREVAVVYDNGTTVLARLPARANQAASLTRVYSFFQGAIITTPVTDTTLTVPLPFEIVLVAGSRVRTITTALDAGDNWGAPLLLIERFRP